MTGDAILELKNLITERETVIDAPSSSYLLRQPDGSFKHVDVPLKAQNYKVFDTATLAELATSDDTILVSDTKAVLIKEFNNIRTLHTLELPLHPVYKLACELQNSVAYDQKKLLRMLRTKLAGFLDETLAPRFEKLKVTSKGETERTISNGVDAIGKNLEQRALLNGEKPINDFYISTPVFDVPEFLLDVWEINVVVEIEPEPLVVVLTSVYGDVVSTKREALEGIVTTIKGKTSARVLLASL
jgi:hypothetical protein